MKKIFSLLIVLLSAGSSLAAERNVTLEGDTLIVPGIEVRYPNVPIGVSPEDAYQLVTGEISSLIVHDTKESFFRLGWPGNRHIISSQRLVRYTNERFITEKGVPNEVIVSHWGLTIFSVVVPSIGIFFVSLYNQKRKLGTKELFVFYVTMLIVAIVVVATEIFPSLGDTWYPVVQILACFVIINVMFDSPTQVPALVAIFCVGVSTDMLERETGWQYPLIIAAMQVISFTIAKTMTLPKRNIREGFTR